MWDPHTLSLGFRGFGGFWVFLGFLFFFLCGFWGFRGVLALGLKCWGFGFLGVGSRIAYVRFFCCGSYAVLKGS